MSEAELITCPSKCAIISIFPLLAGGPVIQTVPQDKTQEIVFLFLLGLKALVPFI